MSDLDHYFAESMSEDERLINFQALSRGAFTGLNYFLQRLGSYFDLLELELDDSPAGQIYLNESSVALARAGRLLGCLHDYATSRGKEFENFDLQLLISGIARRMEEINLADINLTLELPDETAFIRGRQFMLQQLLFEIPPLFRREEQEKLALHCGLNVGHMDDIFFQGRKSPLKAGEYYALAISTSDMIPPVTDEITILEKLFSSKDVQLDDRLIFLYGIILEHGGELFTNRGDSLDSLTVLLPTVRNKANMFGEGPVDESELQGSETVLLVDDEGIIWDVVIDMLQKLGYTVILAENGVDCVEIYRENPGEIDLILLDMVMPKMNGHEAFFKLKEIDPNVRVMLQSGYINQKEAQDVLRAGALGFLQKPYRMHELARKIREIIDG